MSTIKADAVTALSAGGDLSLDGLGTGGVSIASTLKMTKGGDISSASPLVIDTDGNYFDVTGTTNFAAMTVESGNFFMLQFDGALTITHGSGIELPGASNLTTATGDRLICYATAANTVEVMSVETEAAVAAAGLVLVQTLTLSGASTATLTSAALFDGTYDRIQIEGTAIDTSAAAAFNMTLSDDDGTSFESADYRFHTTARVDGATTYTSYVSGGTSAVEILHLTGSIADESAEFTIKTGGLVGTAFHKLFYWQGATMNATAVNFCTGAGCWAGGVTAIDQIRFLPASGTFSGIIRAYGLVDS